jgi:ankyrin repeat protein
MCCYHYAARHGNAELVETLAERGVKLNMTDEKGNTGIHIACDYIRHASSYQRTAEDYFRVVKAFADGGVDTGEKNEYGIPALDIAIKNDAKKIAAFLSGAVMDESAITAGGMTLHQAAEKGDAEAIKAIAASGADLNGHKDDKVYKFGGATPLAIAVAFLQVNAVEALLAAGANPSFKDGNGRAALSFLVEGSYYPKAVEEKRIPRIIKAMLSAGYKINETVDDDGNTLLLLACKSGGGYAAKNHTKKGDIIDEALKNSADINLANRFGETALMHACGRDFDIMENVQLTLLENGAGTAAADRNGDTALHYAARNDSKTGAKTLCDMLLEFGADAKAVNNDGKTALDIATENDNEPLVKLLLGKM